MLKKDKYAKDYKLVFYEGEVIKTADVATFESIGKFYAKDKTEGTMEKIQLNRQED